MNATVEGWSSGSTVCFTPMLFPQVLSAKQGIACTIFQVFGMTRPGIEPRPNDDTRTKRAFYHWAMDAILCI